VKTNTSLVPPALTLCVGAEQYSVNVTVYGEYPDQKSFLTSFTNDLLDQYSSLGSILSECWIIRAPNNESIIQDPPPKANTPDLVITYTRVINNVTSSPIWLNIFDPLETSTLFTFNRFLELDADQNRAVSFTRTVRVDLNGKETNDVLYNIVTEYRDPTWTVPGFNATSKITIRAASFVITKVSDVATNWWTIFRDCFTLLGVLYSAYLPIVGRGRYRPWGILHSIAHYYPVEHIKQKGETGLGTKEEAGLVTKEEVAPTIDERLDIYLDRFRKAKYDN